MPFLRKRRSIGVKGHRLTPKMISYIDEYMIDFNATEAVLRSDYSTSSKYLANRFATELMAHPLIKEEIERRLAKKSQIVEIRKEKLIQSLLQIIDSTDERTSDRLRAIELAGKTIGAWIDRQEISGPDGEAIKHEQHIRESVADFTGRIASLAQRTGTDGTTVIPFPGTTGRAEVALEVLGETQSTSPDDTV